MPPTVTVAPEIAAPVCRLTTVPDTVPGTTEPGGPTATAGGLMTAGVSSSCCAARSCRDSPISALPFDFPIFTVPERLSALATHQRLKRPVRHNLNGQGNLVILVQGRQFVLDPG